MVVAVERVGGDSVVVAAIVCRCQAGGLGRGE